jgi:hypothetical protein
MTRSRNDRTPAAWQRLLRELPPPRVGGRLVTRLVEEALEHLRADRADASAISLARVLLFYPVGHPARPEIMAILASVRSATPDASSSRRSRA